MSREELLTAAVDHCAENGLGDLSLRRLGTAIGSSHRMLIYHFGSRDGLLTAIVREVEQRQRQALAADLAELAGDPVAAARRMWRRLSGPELAATERLFYELYGRALAGDPGAAPLLDDIVRGWVEPLVKELSRGSGAYWLTRHDVRLGLAVMRGLLLDVLATGDVEETTEALETFLDRYRV
jgi:AcrR family transcriptional regulator